MAIDPDVRGVRSDPDLPAARDRVLGGIDSPRATAPREWLVTCGAVLALIVAAA